MGGRTADIIVERAIAHARRMAGDPRYDWMTARAALARILDDLETRAAGDASLERLRRFIAEGDRAFARRAGES